MKKGLTLVEMIAVMTIFAIIVLISFPVVDGMIKRGNEEKYNLFLNDVYLATEAYIQKYSDDYPDLNSSYVFVYMKELIEDNFIKSTVIDPMYNRQISSCGENDNCYTIIVGKNTIGLLYYILVDGTINNVCIEENNNCDNVSNTAVFERNEDGSLKLVRVE